MIGKRIPEPRILAGVVWSAGAVLAVSVLVAISFGLGPYAKHMGLHILLMNVAAPVLAVLVAWGWPLSATRSAYLWIATLVQIALLWMAHAPVIQNLALSHLAFQLSIHGALLLAAFLFWIALLTLSEQRRWQGLLALAVTGKLACLLAALLVFAPRTLYLADHPHAAHLLSASAALHDQHVAGLLMMAACPISYMIAAIISAAQLLIPERRPGAMANFSG